MNQESIIRTPLLDEAGSRMDWLNVAYRTAISIGVGSAEVSNSLDGAVSLSDLVNGGQAAWAVELRCPRTLMGRVYTSKTPTFTVSWDTSSVAARVFLRPGLVVTEDVVLPPNELHPGIWPEPVLIPAGTWLAQGRMYASESLSSSLLRWTRDTSLSDGRMRVEPDTSSGEIVFYVRLSDDLYNRLQQSRDLQVAALIAACAHLPELWADVEDRETGIFGLLRTRFKEAGMEWDDNTPASFDPALAATILEQFEVLADLNEDDE